MSKKSKNTRRGSTNGRPLAPARNASGPLRQRVVSPVPTVSACLIVKNEEANIERCLRSLQGAVDEVVVVDTGSTDRTIDIAQQFDVKLAHFPWCEDFAAARNASIAQASSDWVIWIDADEELVEPRPGALRRLCQQPAALDGYLVSCRSLANETGEISTVIRQWRLFNNHRGLHFESRIHEHLVRADGGKAVDLTFQEDVWIRHWGYIPKPEIMRRKRDRNFALLRLAAEDRPDDPFVHYNVGKQYVAEHQFGPGLLALEKAVELWASQGQTPFAFVGNMFALAINAAVETGDLKRALELEGETPAGFMSADVLFQAGVAYSRLKRYDEAIARLNRAWRDPVVAQGIESDPSSSTWRPLGALAHVYMELDQRDAAYDFAKRAYALAPTRPNILYALGFISGRRNQLDEAVGWARQLLAGELDEGFKAKARRLLVNIGRGLAKPELVLEGLRGPVEGLSEVEVAQWLAQAQTASAAATHMETAAPAEANDPAPLNLASVPAQATQIPAKPSAERPRLSVLVPAYNRLDFLAQTLTSLERVTVRDCEIVVVDDASTQEVGALVKRQAERDPRIRYVRYDDNAGPTGNFNRAIAQARGEYFSIIGDDDLVLPGNFEKKLAILDANPSIGLVYSRHYYCDEDGNSLGLALWPGMLSYSYIGGRPEFSDLFPWNYISLHTVVYRRRLWEEYGGFDENITECGNDWELNLRYCYHTQTAYIDEPLVNVRVHAGATTNRLGVTQSKLAEGRIAVWRKWLVDQDEPIILADHAWKVMHELFDRDLRHWFPNNPETINRWLGEFDKLRHDHVARVSPRFPLNPPPSDDHRGPVCSTIPVVWEGGFFETHSLAMVNRELALAALKSGEIDLSLQLRELEAVKFDPRGEPRLRVLLDSMGRQLASQPLVHIRHAWPPVLERPAQGKWVMVQPWEYGRLPIEWVAPMRDLTDEIWAYSHAVRQFYMDSGVPGDKIHIVPLGIDPERFRPDFPPIALPSKKRLRFLFVGGTIWRKGIDILLQAYCRTFTRRDDVCLVIKDMGQNSFYKGQGAAETIARLQADPAGPEIVYITGELADKDMAAVYTACHCLVHPYRGEGFGLPVAEAMACGLPAIVTRGGACDDFCQDDTAYFVPSVRRPVNLEVPTAGQAWVLEADVEALGARMRGVYENQREAAERGQRASAWVRQNLTWDAAAQKAIERLRALTDSAQVVARAVLLPAPPTATDYTALARPLNILVACVHYAMADGRYMTRALRRMGHNVKTAGPYRANKIWGIEVDARYNWLPDVETPDVKQYPLDAVLDAFAADDWRPDLIITADSAFTLIGGAACPHVLWGVDNHLEDYRLREFDQLFLAHSWGARMCEPNAHWLPPAYDPQAHFDQNAVRDLDVVMVGVGNPDRNKAVTALVEGGVQVAHGVGLIWDEYNQLYNRAKIGFAKSVRGDVPQRILENMAQGCCVLCDRCRDLDPLGFVAGTHYWPYDSAEDAVLQARYLLGSGRWQEIAAAGQAAVRPHTWEARASKLLAVATEAPPVLSHR